jgi:hypothetical protein
VLGDRGRELAALDLDHFDCFNHARRLEVEKGHFFLQGTPPSSHLAKRLCHLGDAGQVTPLAP